MVDYLGVITLFVILVGVLTYSYYRPRPFVVDAYHRGIRFRDGQIVGEVGPGRHKLRPRSEDIVVFDVRRRQLVVPGQEILSSDHVPVKVSLVAMYSIVDVVKAATVVESYEEALYVSVQLAARNVIAGKELVDALAARLELGAEITDLTRESALEFGVEIHDVQVRDFMLAGSVKQAYADVVIARQQGLSALEKARGESAAIRNLANSAQLMERHPGLMQLRLLQAVENSTGNRVVIALDSERGSFEELQANSEPDS